MLRFVAVIDNPLSQTRVGVVTEWVAMEAADAIVGSVKTHQPPLAGRSTHTYVGGAGSVLLTGTPVAVSVNVVNKGTLTKEAGDTWAVDSVSLTPEFRTGEYRVTATVTTGSRTVAAAQITANVVLKDAAGSIVGADFETPENLPAAVPPNTKFAVEFRFVSSTSEPATAEVTAYASQ